MHVPLTFCVLGALTAALLLLRWRWDGFSQGAQRVLMAAAALGLLLRGVGLATNYSVSVRIDAVMYWMCLAGYGILLVRYSLLRPRWVTSAIAVVLALPILAATPFLPLTELFDQDAPVRAPLSGGMYSELRRIEVSPVAVNGAEFNIYSRSAWAPFLRRRRETARLLDSQCDTSQTYAVIQPDGQSVRVTCPAWPGEPPSAEHTAVVPLR